jgi:hypothetical protein
MANAIPGQPWPLSFVFYNEPSGTLTDPAGLSLDITYGGEVGFVPDVAGTFYYTPGGSGEVIQRTGTGQYSFAWTVPADAPAGVYTANWTAAYEGNNFLGVENFFVAGGTNNAGGVPVPGGDIGFWTGTLDYVPQPGTPSAPMTVSIGAVDSNGTAWLWNKLLGWDGPDVQGGGVTPRSGDQGAYPSPQYYAARQMTLTITAMAQTQALRDVARNQLQQAIPVSDPMTFTYDEPVPKFVTCRRSGKVTESYTDVCAVQFTIPLTAWDPRKYGTTVNVSTVNAAPPEPTTGFTFPLTFPLTPPAQSPGGSVAVTNGGNFETRPMLTVTGPITSPAITNVTTMQTISWTGLVVPAGVQLVIDTLNGQAALGGQYRPADPFSSWWCLPPGTSTIQLGGQADAGASLSIAEQDAYV